MSNIIDAYCVYCCAQEVKKHTEETKEMTSKKAYINRKRYILFSTTNIMETGDYLNTLFSFSETMESQSKF